MQKWTDPLCGFIVLDYFRSWYSPQLQINQKLSCSSKYYIVQHTSWAKLHPLLHLPMNNAFIRTHQNCFRVFVCTHCSGDIEVQTLL